MLDFTAYFFHDAFGFQVGIVREMGEDVRLKEGAHVDVIVTAKERHK